MVGSTRVVMDTVSSDAMRSALMAVAVTRSVTTITAAITTTTNGLVQTRLK